MLKKKKRGGGNLLFLPFPPFPLAGLGFLLFPISSVHLPSNKEALQPQNDFVLFGIFVVGVDNIYSKRGYKHFLGDIIIKNLTRNDKPGTVV